MFCIPSLFPVLHGSLLTLPTILLIVKQISCQSQCFFFWHAYECVFRVWVCICGCREIEEREHVSMVFPTCLIREQKCHSINPIVSWNISGCLGAWGRMFKWYPGMVTILADHLLPFNHSPKLCMNGGLCYHAFWPQRKSMKASMH